MLAGSFVRFFGEQQPETTNSGAPFWTPQQVAWLLSRYERPTEETQAVEQAETSSVTPGLPGSLLRYRRQIAAIEAQALADWTADMQRMAALYELELMLADAEALAALLHLRNRLDEEALVLILANL